MGLALIVEFPRGWCGGSGPRVLQRSVLERFGIKTALESWISKCFRIRDRRKTGRCCAWCVGGVFSKQLLRNANHQPARTRGRSPAEAVGHDDPPKRTRPSGAV